MTSAGPQPPLHVVFHYAAGPALKARLAELSSQGLDIMVCDEEDDARLAGLLPRADVIWHVLRPLTAAMIAAAPRLRLIQKIGVGINTIDLGAAASRGIPVCNLPGTNTRAVVEMTLALMLGAARKLPQFDAALRRGVWKVEPAVQDTLGELGGRTVGLIGYGAVARGLAPILKAMGCRVIYTARDAKPDAGGEYRHLDALLGEADVVSLHLPLTPETAGLIDAAAFRRMKWGALFVNTARGGIVDQAALTAALQSGQLGAAGLDVFQAEPPDVTASLFRLDNVVVAPHIAWLTTGTVGRSLSIAAENCARLRSGAALLHRVQ